MSLSVVFYCLYLISFAIVGHGIDNNKSIPQLENILENKELSEHLYSEINVCLKNYPNKNYEYLKVMKNEIRDNFNFEEQDNQLSKKKNFGAASCNKLNLKYRKILINNFKRQYNKRR